MKETISQSKWIGKVLNCKTCNKSFIVEAGDVIYSDKQDFGHSLTIEWCRFFKLPCGHNWKIPPHMDKENH